MALQMTIGAKPPFPTSTIHAIRLCLFQATRRPEKIEKIVETNFGRIRIKGRLGQAHLDVFEAICYSREKKKEVDGRIHILVDPWEVRKKSGQMSGTTLKKITDDLLEVIIEIIVLSLVKTNGKSPHGERPVSRIANRHSCHGEHPLIPQRSFPR